MMVPLPYRTDDCRQFDICRLIYRSHFLRQHSVLNPEHRAIGSRNVQQKLDVAQASRQISFQSHLHGRIHASMDV